MSGGLLEQIRDAIDSRSYGYTAHAADSCEARGVLSSDIEEAILDKGAEIIEDYPDDISGSCCLIFGWTSDGRPLHVCMSYPPGVRVITAYEPHAQKWIDYRKRR